MKSFCPMSRSKDIRFPKPNPILQASSEHIQATRPQLRSQVKSVFKNLFKLRRNHLYPLGLNSSVDQGGSIFVMQNLRVFAPEPRLIMCRPGEDGYYKREKESRPPSPM